MGIINNDIKDLSPVLRIQQNVDEDKMKFLYIFHFIFASLAFLFMMSSLASIFLFDTMFSNAKIWQIQKHMLPPEEFFSFFRMINLITGLLLFVSVVLNIISGFFLLRKKHRTFSLIVGGINCLNIPFGTILGVFTIITLKRDSIRKLYSELRTNGDDVKRMI